MKKYLLIVSILIGSFSLSAQNTPALKLQYDFPATAWENEALPLGNGNIGAMVYGDVPIDVIQIN